MYRKLNISYFPSSYSKKNLISKIKKKFHNFLFEQQNKNANLKYVKTLFFLRANSVIFKDKILCKKLKGVKKAPYPHYYFVKGYKELPFLPKIPAKVFFLDLFEKKKAKKIQAETENDPGKFIQAIKSVFRQKMEKQFEIFLNQRIREIISKMKYYSDEIPKLFDSHNLKRVIFEDGHSGDMMPFVRAANLSSISTEEFQHGLISENHPAYNMSYKTKKLINKYKLLPKKMWLDPYSFTKIKIFSQKKKKTLPHFKKQVQKKGPVLVALNGLDNKNIFKMLNKNLNKKIPFLIKAHPLIDAQSKEYLCKHFQDKCQLDFGQNPLDLIKKSSLVVGEFSSLLVEAHEMGKPVIVLKSKISEFFIPSNIGRRIRPGGKLFVNDSKK